MIRRRRPRSRTSAWTRPKRASPPGSDEAGSAAGPAELVATLRHHGHAAWGAPGSDARITSPVPTGVDEDWNGVTVCMHLADYQATTASMVAWLPRDPEEVLQAWVALGSPCASVYVPVFPPFAVPSELGDPATWQRFATLAQAGRVRTP